MEDERLVELDKKLVVVCEKLDVDLGIEYKDGEVVVF